MTKAEDIEAAKMRLATAGLDLRAAQNEAERSVIAAAAVGIPKRTIATLLGVAHTTVYRWLAKQ